MIHLLLLLTIVSCPLGAPGEPQAGYASYTDSILPRPWTGLPARPGDPAPDFPVVDLLAGTTAPLSAFRGRAVYVDFWATWCPACLPVLDRANRLAGAKQKEWEGRVVLAGVSLDRDLGTARDAVRANGWGRMRQLWSGPDLSGRENLAAKAFGIVELPYAVLIDTSGTVVWRGNPVDHPAEERIEALLNGTKSR